MENLKQRMLEHIADLLDDVSFDLNMRLADCIDPLPSDKSELHLMMTESAFKVFCDYFNKVDNTKKYDIQSVINNSVTISKDKYDVLKRDSENLQKISF